jgi:hypothetical protein
MEAICLLLSENKFQLWKLGSKSIEENFVCSRMFCANFIDVFDISLIREQAWNADEKLRKYYHSDLLWFEIGQSERIMLYNYSALWKSQISYNLDKMLIEIEKIWEGSKIKFDLLEFAEDLISGDWKIRKLKIKAEIFLDYCFQENKCERHPYTIQEKIDYLFRLMKLPITSLYCSFSKKLLEVVPKETLEEIWSLICENKKLDQLVIKEIGSSAVFAKRFIDYKAMSKDELEEMHHKIRDAIVKSKFSKDDWEVRALIDIVD